MTMPKVVTQEQFDVAFGARVQELRTARHMSQFELADTIGVTQKMMSKYEIGRANFPNWRLYSLCRALRVSVITLYAPLFDLFGDGLGDEGEQLSLSATTARAAHKLDVMPDNIRRPLINYINEVAKGESAN